MAIFGCRGFVFLFACLQFSLLKTYGGATEVCISKGGRFPPYTRDGQPPRKVRKGRGDLNICRVFRQRTCCDITQTYPAILSLRRLASLGDASKECLHLWELLECSICDPWVGVQQGPPLICASFCDRVYDACSMSYFSIDQMKKVLAPCEESDVLCARASVLVSNGTELCDYAGFSVESYDDPEGISCYGGKASLDYIQNSWGSSETETLPDQSSTHAPESFRQMVADKVFSGNRYWTAAVIFVIAALLVFASRRKTRNHRQRERAVQALRRQAPADQRRGRRIGYD